LAKREPAAPCRRLDRRYLPAMADWGMIVGDRRAWVRDVSLTAALSLFYALLAPFGTNTIPLQQRIVEDFALGFACMALLWPPMRLALRLGERAGLPELFVLVAGLVVLSAPVTLIGVLIVRLFTGGGPPANLVAVYFMILTMVLPGGMAYLMIERRLLNRPLRPRAEPASDPPPAGAPARLLARLNPRLGREVLALQGEDHYVRVHTAQGSELLLMRLGDAVAELDGLQGERVHRSWWVAKDAVGSARVSGRRAALTLTNGLEVPASREATARLRRAGWIG
jgi:hypothetical protein